MHRWIWMLALAGCARAAAPPGPLVVTDDAGVVTTLPRPAGRVVSLMPAATELVFALGAGGSLVGRTRWCDFPAAAAQVPSVGDGLAPNVEAILGTKPDLVLMYRSAGNSLATARLRGLGIPVLELAFDRQSDFEHDAAVVGRALGRDASADSLVRAVRTDLDSSSTTTEGPGVFVLAWADPPITIGGGSFLSEIIRRAGAHNVFADSPQPSFPVSIEAVVGRRPELILAVGADDPAFLSRAEWQAVPAVRARRLVRVEGSMFNRPSPRIALAVRELRSALAAARP